MLHYIMFLPLVHDVKYYLENCSPYMYTMLVRTMQYTCITWFQLPNCPVESCHQDKSRLIVTSTRTVDS